MDKDGEEYDTLAGVIVAAHGVQGTVKVRPATATAEAMLTPPSGGPSKPSLPVWMGPDPAEGRLCHVLSAKRQQPKGGLLVRLAEVPDRTAAERIVGQKLYTPGARRTPLEPDEYFVDDLVGLQAVTEAGRDLGKITAIVAQPASDVYETDRGVLIPAVKAFVVEVDLPGRRLVVRDIPGLLPEEQDEA